MSWMNVKVVVTIAYNCKEDDDYPALVEAANDLAEFSNKFINNHTLYEASTEVKQMDIDKNISAVTTRDKASVKQNRGPHASR